MAHVRQSGLDSGLGFSLSDLIASSDTEAGMLRKLRLLEDPKKGVVLQVPHVAHVWHISDSHEHIRQFGLDSGTYKTVRTRFGPRLSDKTSKTFKVVPSSIWISEYEVHPNSIVVSTN